MIFQADVEGGAAENRLAYDSGWKQIPKSRFANNSRNPIRDIFVQKFNDTGCVKKPIRMHLGDPTLGGNLPPSNITKNAMHKVIDSDHFNGYFSSVGKRLYYYCVSIWLNAKLQFFVSVFILLISNILVGLVFTSRLRKYSYFRKCTLVCFS